MTNRFVAPSLADLSQDIVGDIPFDLISKRNLSAKKPADHTKLLEPFVITGTVVSSDASGLSKLSGQRHILEVLKLVSQPKELIFKHGSAIGGQAVGTWVADNTQMFYPDAVASRDIRKAMTECLRDIAKTCEVQVGMALHYGSFISLGGGLFGRDADLVEKTAENTAKGGELIVLQTNKKTTSKKITQAQNLDYPMPFDQAFYSKLMSGANPNTDFGDYFENAVVILVKVWHQEKMLLLQQLTNWALANATLKNVAEGLVVRKIKANGSLGIFLTKNVEQAIEFAKAVREALKLGGFASSMGISEGEILVFPMANKHTEIAGEPVNIASKLAEDVGKIGKIYIHDYVMGKIKFSKTVSGINLEGTLL